MPRALVIAPPSPHTAKWVSWIDALPGWSHELLTYGIEVPDLAGRSRTVAVANLVRGVRSVRAAPHADVVNAHWLAGPGWIASLAGRTPLVVSIWGSDILVHAERTRLGALLTWLSTRRATALTYDAEILADALVRAGFDRHRLHRVVLGPNSKVFNRGVTGAVAGELGAPPGSRVVLSPRGLAPVYQPEMAVAAFASADVAGTVLLVRVTADDAESRQALDVTARRYGVGDRVIAYEPVAAERLPELYASVDAVLSVPRSDGTSVTVLESLFCERPVVATDIPANREWLPHELLGPVSDPSALGAVLRRVLTDPDWAGALTYGAAQRARDLADEPTQIAAMGALYEAVASGKSR